MKGKHDLAPVISTGDSRKGNHHHHNQSKHTWDSLGSMCGGLECGEAHNPGAIVIKKEGGVVDGGSQINRTKHSHFSHHISLVPPLRETATKKDIYCINWEVWVSAFPVLAKQTGQSGSKQLLWKFVSVLAGCLSVIWKCHRTITNNHPLQLPDHQQRAYLHKDTEKQTLRPGA